MAGHIKELTEQDVANEYNQMVSKLSVYMDKLYEMADRCEYLSRTFEDNADPQLAFQDALYYLGKVIVCCKIYADEYAGECLTDKTESK